MRRSRFRHSPGPPVFGFVAQRVERHVEGVSVAVSKSAEATKMSARSLAWLEALALHPANIDPFAGARSGSEFTGVRISPRRPYVEHLWCELDEPPRYERGLRSTASMQVRVLPGAPQSMKIAHLNVSLKTFV